MLVIFQRALNSIVMVTVLALTGLGLQPLERSLRAEVAVGRPELSREGVEAAVGRGLVVGVLGGLRTVVADFVWLGAYRAWEERDRAATEALIRLATALDPRPLFFWTNGARMIAYDMPHWRVRELGGPRKLPQSVVEEINREHAELALGLLADGLEHHPQAAQLFFEAGQIHLNRLGDLEAAADWYRRGLEFADAASAPVRTYADLLRSLDRLDEARDVLIRHHRALLDSGDRFRADAVLERIRGIEDETELEAPEHYVPAPAGEE